MKPILIASTAILALGLCTATAMDTNHAAALRPEIVTREQWGSKPEPLPDTRKHTPKFITIHHAGVTWKTGGDPVKFIRNMQTWGQTEKHWPDLPYHFLIAPDGRTFEGRPLQYEPESNTKYDLQGHIGVELMGNFEEQRVSKAQLASCARLVAWLCHELHVPPGQIAGHMDRAKGQTDCPGRDFYRYIRDGQMQRWVEGFMGPETPKIELLPPLPNGPTSIITLR